MRSKPWIPESAPVFRSAMRDPQLDGVFPYHNGFTLEFEDGSTRWLDSVSVKLLLEVLTLPRDSRGNPIEDDDEDDDDT